MSTKELSLTLVVFSLGLKFHLQGVRNKGKQIPYNECKGMKAMAKNHGVT